MAEDNLQTDYLELATELTVAWLANPNTRVSGEDVPTFLQTMHAAVTNLAAPAPATEEAQPDTTDYTPAVSVRKSLASKDHIISMIDGKPYKTLKRHLAGKGLSPAEYRERYGLKADYPMVAESYAEMRRGLAKKIGLGRKAKEQPAETTPAPKKIKVKVTLPKKAKAAEPASAPGQKGTLSPDPVL